MFQILFATTLFALAVGEEAPKYEKCNSTLGKVVGITLSGPEVEGGKYILKRGTEIKASGDFTTNQEVKQATVVGKAIIYSSFAITFNLNNSDVCEVVKCPLQKDVQYHMETSATVNIGIYSGDIILQMKVIDTASNGIIACAQFPAKVVSDE